MNNKLVQTGFFDLEEIHQEQEQDEIVIAADWMALPDDDFEQIVEERLDELDQQEAAIDAFVKFAKSNIIRERGELYMAAKAKLPHGRYLKLLKRRGVEPRTAQEYSLITREHGSELSNAQRAAHLGFRTWQKIVRSPESHQIVAKIEAGKIDPTPKAINAELEAAKQRAKELEEANRLLQGDLSLFKAQTEQERENERQEQQRKLDTKQKELQLLQWEKSLKESEYEAKLNQNAERISSVEAQLLSLKAEKEQIEQAKIQIIKEDTPETKDKLDKLEQQLKAKEEKEKKSKEWKKILLEENEKLAKELQDQRYANEARRKQEMYEFKVKDDCKNDTDSLYRSLKLFASQEPIPRNTRFYGDDEWARYDQIEQALKHCLEVVERIKSTRYHDQFVESNVVDLPVIYEGSSHGTAY